MAKKSKQSGKVRSGEMKTRHHDDVKARHATYPPIQPQMGFAPSQPAQGGLPMQPGEPTDPGSPQGVMQ